MIATVVLKVTSVAANAAKRLANWNIIFLLD